ncbi:mediator complex, subunit Med18 [Lipomyces japonicus]|uniref:mediator complex, subunit Med18 n=1 Tax=Lipomyces japonicus TaxID=56871 RepID=UPI0034CD78C9
MLVQQLSLYAAFSPAKLSQVLSTLSALTGMRPISLLEHHIVFSPTTATSAGAIAAPAGPPTAAPLESSRIDAHRDMLVDNDAEQDWCLTVATLPESGKRPVQVQTLHSSQLQFGPLFQYLRAIGYVYVYDYLERGHVFVHNGIVVVRVTQIAPQEPLQLHEIATFDKNEVVATETVAQGRDVNAAKFVGTYVVHAYVDVKPGSGVDQDLLGKAQERLESIKYEIRSLLELEIPDRSLLDPRVQIRR